MTRLMTAAVFSSAGSETASRSPSAHRAPWAAVRKDTTLVPAGERGRQRARIRGRGVRIVSVQLRRWSRQEYDRMIDAGVLTPEDHVELIDGDIVTVTRQKSRHATAVRLAGTALRHAFGE